MFLENIVLIKYKSYSSSKTWKVLSIISMFLSLIITCFNNPFKFNYLNKLLKDLSVQVFKTQQKSDLLSFSQISLGTPILSLEYGTPSTFGGVDELNNLLCQD